MCCAANPGALPDLVHTHPAETVRDAIGILREYGVSQMPVVGAEPPVMAGEVAGSVSERELLSAVFEGRAKLADAVSQHMSPPLPHHRGRRVGQRGRQGAARLGRADGGGGGQTGRGDHPLRPAGISLRRAPAAVVVRLLRSRSGQPLGKVGKVAMTDQPPSASLPAAPSAS